LQSEPTGVEGQYIEKWLYHLAMMGIN